MSKHKKQAHVVWKCDYHIVWTPKYRFRILSGLVKDLVDHDIRMLSEWKGCEVIELNVQLDHIHLVVSIPPKVSVSEYMAGPPSRDCKREAGDQIVQELSSVESDRRSGRSLIGAIIAPATRFWSRGYFVNTVGINEDHIRRYVKYQEGEDRKEDKQSTNFELFGPSE